MRLAPTCLLLPLAVASVSGCFTSSPASQSAKNWRVAVMPEAGRPGVMERTDFAVTRLGSVTVMAPYDKASFAVLRADGSVAFDPYNVFAAVPGQLLRAPMRELLEAEGRYGRVVESTSAATADAVAETLVTDLSLDCSEEGARVARAAVSVRFVENSRGCRRIVSSGTGIGSADAADGDYTKAFSTAFSAAVRAALKDVRP